MQGNLYLVATPPPEWSKDHCLRQLESALEGGVDIVQLRLKAAPDSTVLHWGEAVKALCGRYGAMFTLNDRPDLAAILQADGLHCGQTDAAVRYARGVFSGALGISTHNPNQAEVAAAELVSYVSVGPVWPTPTKPGRPAVGLGYVRHAAQNLSLPWFAIGGIDATNINQVVEAGARRVAVVRSVLQAQHPATVVKQLKEVLRAAG